MNQETGETLNMGPLTTLPPDTVTLFDADIDQSMPEVTSTGIRFANAFLELSSPRQLVAGSGETLRVSFPTFFLTLEAKLGTTSKNVANVETGSLPVEAIVTRLREQE